MLKKMKNIFKYTLAFALALPFFAACAPENDLSPDSIIVADQYEKNEFDLWLDANYVSPYNIEFKYRYESNESNLTYYTIPADYDCSVILAHLVKYLCIETYDEVAGVNFTRSYFPKEFFLIGEWQYRNNGTYILGTAESGKKILLAGVNYVISSLSSAENLNRRYIKTIHHEFTHILNQTLDYPASFQEVTATSYVADLWSEDEYDSGYEARGFISAYAQHSHGEDFAEMVSMYVTHDEEWWQNLLADAGETGSSYLLTKLGIVKAYMSETFSIDLDVLRSAVLRRQAEVMAGEVDLTSLAIN